MTRLVAIAILAALAGSARADDRTDQLAEAKRLESQLDFEPALAIVEKLLASGGNDRDRFLELHLFAGKLAAGLDRGAVAEEHFARVLALEPTRVLPEGTSPKITGPFDAARGRTPPLRITAKLEAASVSLTVEGDSLQLVAGISAVIDGTVTRGQGLQLPTPRRPSEVRALDAFGNTLWMRTFGPSDAEARVQRVAFTKPLYKRPTVWGTAFLVSAAGTTLCAWRLTVAQDDFDQQKRDGGHDYTELRALQRRGEHWALATNIGLGVTAATAIGTVFALLSGGDEPPANYLVATPSSIGVVGRF